MRHYSFLLFFLFIIACNADIFAQHHKVFYGINASLEVQSYRFTKTSNYIDYLYEPNYSLGATLGVNQNERFSMRSNLSYSQKDLKRYFDYSRAPWADGDDTLRMSDVHHNDYLDIGIACNYLINRNEKIRISAAVGVVNSILIGHERKLLWSSEDVSLGTNSNYSDYLLSAKCGIGLTYNAGPIGFYLEPQVRFFLNSANRNYSGYNPIHLGIELQILRI